MKLCHDCVKAWATTHYVMGAARCDACASTFDADVRAERQAEADKRAAYVEANAVDYVLACPYCGTEAEGKRGCCGESSEHFEHLPVGADGNYL